MRPAQPFQTDKSPSLYLFQFHPALYLFVSIAMTIKSYNELRLPTMHQLDMLKMFKVICF